MLDIEEDLQKICDVDGVLYRSRWKLSTCISCKDRKVDMHVRRKILADSREAGVVDCTRIWSPKYDRVEKASLMVVAYFYLSCSASKECSDTGRYEYASAAYRSIGSNEGTCRLRCHLRTDHHEHPSYDRSSHSSSCSSSSSPHSSSHH